MSEVRSAIINKWSNRDARDHFVYIIGCLHKDNFVGGPTKVGISYNPDNRLKQIQATRSEQLVLVASFGFWKRSYARQVEAAFHRVVDSYRWPKTEWFDLPPYHVIGIMSGCLRVFMAGVLCPDNADDFDLAADYLGLPGEVGIDHKNFAREFGMEPDRWH